MQRLVQILLSGGADTDIQNSLGQTPLISAVSQGYADMVQLLLAYGADPVQGTTLPSAGTDAGAESCSDGADD